MKTFSTHKRSTLDSHKKSIQGVAGLVVIAIAALSLTSCAMSDSTKDAGKTAICAAGGSLIGQIRTGGAVSKFVAGVVADNSTGETKALAEKVANGQGGEDAVDDLATYVDELCN